MDTNQNNIKPENETNDSNVGLEEILSQDEIFVPQKINYPVKKILLSIVALLAVSIIGFIGAGISNAAHYKETENKLYSESAQVIDEWMQNYEAVAETEFTVGQETNTSYPSRRLHKELKEVKEYSGLKVLTLHGVKVHVEGKDRYELSKDGETVYSKG